VSRLPPRARFSLPPKKKAGDPSSKSPLSLVVESAPPFLSYRSPPTPAKNSPPFLRKAPCVPTKTETNTVKGSNKLAFTLLSPPLPGVIIFYRAWLSARLGERPSAPPMLRNTPPLQVFLPSKDKPIMTPFPPGKWSLPRLSSRIDLGSLLFRKVVVPR